MPVQYIPHPIRAEAYDLILARAYGVVYQNLRLRPIVVVVTSQHTMVGAGALCRTIGYLANVTPPGNVVGFSGFLTAPGASVYHGVLVFHVPPGWYYQVLQQAAGGNANALNEWWEWWL